MKKICCLFIACFIVTNVFAMADNTPPVYGVPTLYGEYEVTNNDAPRASDMYGAGSKRAEPVRVDVAKSAKSAHVAKHPVKAKKAQPKKKKAPKKPVARQVVESQKIESSVPQKTPEMKIVSVDKVPVETKTVLVKPETAPVASPEALDIAVSVQNRKDTESFCTQIKPQGRGNLPDGFVMMPGRPDLMSCVSRAAD